MIVSEILGNIHDGFDLGHRQVDYVDVAGPQRVQRIQRLRTLSGRELGLRLPSGSPMLRDGDVLTLDGPGAASSGGDVPGDARAAAVVVRIQGDDVLLIAPRSAHEMGVVAHTLGNRHLPAQFFAPGSPVGREAGATVMLVAYDQTVVAYLDQHGVPYRRDVRVLDVPLRHADHSH